MRKRFLSKLLFVCSLLVVSFVPASAQTPAEQDAAGLLPARVGDFRAQGAARPDSGGILKDVSFADYAVRSAAARVYNAPGREPLTVTLVQTESDSAAFSLLTLGRWAGNTPVRVGEPGTAAVAGSHSVSFFKGTVFVDVRADEKRTVADNSAAADFAREFAPTLAAGAGVPELALHLPEWERAVGSARYAVSLPALQEAAGNQPALEVVSFEGGAEAVTAVYGQARLVIVEFTTPQFSVDNDALIRQRIEQLRAAGQPAPSAYRRIGNYSAFVFGAPDEASAAGLLAGVKYEKDVRWLDRNPNMLAKAQAAYERMTGNVILASLKITGLSILLCLAVGGLFGGAFFLYRRSQAPADVYSDAGGMVRLNIDDITHETAPPARLLERGDG
ncbi:MAG TPA: DUF6599 family protein [Pyrinomonadaceae bacterium]|nr:DUF6599 family protein [Pyrinomonadaceae bacterium]